MIWFIVILALLEISVPFIYGFKAMSRRYWNMALICTQALNVYTGGDPGEPMSSRAAKQSHKKGWGLLGHILEFIDPGHMKRSVVEDRGDKSAWK